MRPRDSAPTLPEQEWEVACNNLNAKGIPEKKVMDRNQRNA
jgi:hypothetical protein